MKLLTLNFLTCAVKSCKSSTLSFPLHFKDATLERTEIDFNPVFMRNILPRLNWEAVGSMSLELGLEGLVPEGLEEVVEGLLQRKVESGEGKREGKGDGGVEKQGEGEGMDVDTGTDTDIGAGRPDKVPAEREDDVLRKLHSLLLETGVVEGKLVCGNCGFEYPIKDGVGNFLLPAHLV